MSQSLHAIIPDPKQFLELEPEELAGYVLECMNSMSEGEADRHLGRSSFIHDSRVKEYPHEYRNDMLLALTEAWMYLLRDGFIAYRPGQQGDYVFLTRRGKRIKDVNDLKAFQHANLLPKDLLHPVIAQKVWSLFIRGEYDVAVFQAFKEVEVAVRQAGHFPETEIGAPLMRKAFHPEPENGPLTDTEISGAEQQALSDLFAGSIGSYKNPHSHRHVNIDAPEAVEMIMLASHLLKIVDSKKES